MSLITLLFISWHLFMGARGWFRGFWAMLGSLISWLLAYVVALWFAPDLAPQMRDWGIPGGYSTAAAGAALWVVSMLIFSISFKFLLHFIATGGSRLERFSGAGLGLITASFSGLVVIWAIGVIRDTANQPGTTASVFSIPAGLERSADHLVSAITRVGMDVAGASREASDIAVAAVREPGRLVRSAKALAETPALQNLMADPEAREMMRSGDIENLQNTTSFKAMLESPAANELVRTLSADGSEGDAFVQDKLARMAVKVQHMRDNPEATELAQDPEVVALVQDEKPWKVLSHPKVQRLMALLSTDGEYEAAGGAGESTAIYRWRSDDGTVNFTDRDRVPEEKLETAEKIQQ